MLMKNYLSTQKPRIIIMVNQSNPIVFDTGAIKISNKFAEKVKTDKCTWEEFISSVICGYFAFTDDVSYFLERGIKFDRELLQEEWIEASVGDFLHAGEPNIGELMN